jgi:hypothetical protein
VWFVNFTVSPCFAESFLKPLRNGAIMHRLDTATVRLVLDFPLSGRPLGQLMTKLSKEFANGFHQLAKRAVPTMR